ncbi:hypothetical protein AB0J86_28505 [Micromonospora sp. NPDC049559]|uniref:hypothetical protein n=1 Tax=Micromonospora sp. NPDC049559 TaxID=3155923 RepID=UPI00343D9C40
MTPDELERALRESLARQAGAPRPAVADPAGTALRRARRIHRRRTVMGAAVVALAIVGISAGVAQLGGASHQPGPTVVVIGDPPGPGLAHTVSNTPVADSSDGPPQLDLVVAENLNVADGESIDLSGIGTVAAVQRSTGGWLVVGESSRGGSDLWFVAVGQPPRELLPGVDALALGPDGQRVAWRAGARLFAAAIRDGALGPRVETGAPARGVPVGFVGVAVLLRLNQKPTGLDAYDLWWPNREPYREDWTAEPVGVYGTLPDGQTVVGQIAAGPSARPCLALLDASRRLAPIRTECTLGLSSGGPGAVSPDGRWLVANGRPGGRADRATASAAGEQALVVDLRTVFDRAAAKPAGPRLVGGTVWTDTDTLVHADERGELVRVMADQAPDTGKDAAPAEVESFPAPGAVPGERVMVVTGAAS